MKTTDSVLPDIRLRFQVEHPNLEACYAYGYGCALENLNETTNPFKEGSLESEQWLEGWWAGWYGEPPMYDLSEYLDAMAITGEVAANDTHYAEPKTGYFTKVLEISGVLAVSAFLGYQVFDMVA